jgi:Fe-S-cluster-containing dehydrogenase component
MQVGPKRVNGRLKTLYIPMPCYHCNPAPCIEACPTGAMKRRAKDGIVYVDSPACIGCKRCMQACPYGAPQYDTRSGTVIKCDFCKDRVDYKKTYTKEDIKHIYRYVLNGGGGVHQPVYDEVGNVKRDNLGRLLDEKGNPLSGKKLVEKRKNVDRIEYNGLWSACSTKCATEAMTFGQMRDLKPFLEKMGKKRDIKRVGSVFYGIPKEDFPAPALEKGWRPKKKRPSKKKKK